MSGGVISNGVRNSLIKYCPGMLKCAPLRSVSASLEAAFQKALNAELAPVMRALDEIIHLLQDRRGS